MKKIISLVVMATMLCTLFAVNVSAAVATGEVTTELVPTYTFDERTAGWEGISGNHANDYTGMSEIKEDPAQGNVLSITPQGVGESSGSLLGHLDIENALVMPSKYEVSFKVKLTSAEGGFMVWIRDIGAHYGIGAGCFETNDWYEMKISIDKTSGSVAKTLMMRNITDNGAWTACPITDDFKTGRWITGWQTDYYPRARMAAGIAFISHFGKNQNYEYLFDDFAIKGISTIPSTGVYYSKNFEDDSTLTVRHGMGTVDAGKESNGNTYGVLKTNASGNMNIVPVAENTIKGVNTKDCWVLEFDVCAKNDGAALIAQVSGTAESGGSMYTLKNLPRDTWYTYKMTYDGNKVAGTPSGRFIEKAVRGTNSWEFVSVFGADAGAAFTDYENSGATETIVFMNGNTAVSEFWIDNITLSALEAVSLPAVSVADNTLSITANFSDVSALYNSPATMAAVLATFAGDVLVDVDFETVANNAGTIAADLEASVAGANKAELYVWDGIGTAKPVLGTVYPLTSYLQ